VHYKYKLRNRSTNDIVLLNLAASYVNIFEIDYTILIGYDEQSSSQALYLIRVDTSSGEIENSFLLRTDSSAYMSMDYMDLAQAPTRAFATNDERDILGSVFFAASYSVFSREKSRHVLFRQYTSIDVSLEEAETSCVFREEVDRRSSEDLSMVVDTLSSSDVTLSSYI